MIIERQRGFYALYALIQPLILLAVYTAWLYIYNKIIVKNLPGGFTSYCIYGAVIGFSAIVVATIDHRYGHSMIVGNIPKRVILAMRSSLVIVSILLFFLVSTKDTLISRGFLFSFIPLLFLGASISNIVIPLILDSTLFWGTYTERCLLISFSDQSLSAGRKKMLINWLDYQSKFGLR